MVTIAQIQFLNDLAEEAFLQGGPGDGNLVNHVL